MGHERKRPYRQRSYQPQELLLSEILSGLRSSYKVTQKINIASEILSLHDQLFF